MSFLPGQKRESYFDIYAASTDHTLDFQPILINLSSCDFSSKTQVFPFPENEISSEYTFIKLVGKGNSLDLWNAFSEIKILGTPHINSLTINIYPNPATNRVYIYIQTPAGMLENTDVSLWTLNITSMSQKLIFQKFIPSGTKKIDFPLTLSSGVYVIALITGPMSMIAQKLIIIK